MGFERGIVNGGVGKGRLASTWGCEGRCGIFAPRVDDFPLRALLNTEIVLSAYLRQNHFHSDCPNKVTTRFEKRESSRSSKQFERHGLQKREN